MRHQCELHHLPRVGRMLHSLLAGMGGPGLNIISRAATGLTFQNSSCRWICAWKRARHHTAARLRPWTPSTGCQPPKSTHSVHTPTWLPSAFSVYTVRPSISTYGFQGSDSHVASCHAACTHTRKPGRPCKTRRQQALRAGQTPGGLPAELTDSGMQAAAGHKTKPKPHLDLRRAACSPDLCRVQRDAWLQQEGHQQLQVALPQVNTCDSWRHTHPHAQTALKLAAQAC